MDLSLEHVRKRIEREDMETPDIFQHIIEKGGLTEVEMLSEAMILIAAGAETTATMLVASSMFGKNISPYSQNHSEVYLSDANLSLVHSVVSPDKPANVIEAPARSSEHFLVSELNHR